MLARLRPHRDTIIRLLAITAAAFGLVLRFPEGVLAGPVVFIGGYVGAWGWDIYQWWQRTFNPQPQATAPFDLDTLLYRLQGQRAQESGMLGAVRTGHIRAQTTLGEELSVDDAGNYTLNPPMPPRYQ